MFLLNSLQPGLHRCKKATHHQRTRCVFALFVLFCFSAVFLLTGCNMDDNDYVDDGILKPGLIGSWVFEYEGGRELYTITADTFIYDDTYMGIWGGSIVHVSNFSDDAGVIIIEYDSDKKQYWMDWDTMSDITPEGNFYGIYFSELKQDSVKLANTNDAEANNGPTETETLQQAIAKFTSGNRGNLTYSGGMAQIRQ